MNRDKGLKVICKYENNCVGGGRIMDDFYLNF